MAGTPYRLFDAVGVELEYMIVDAETLDVRPIADELLKAAAGSYEMEVEFGPFAWSNELALHVIELKTLEPVPTVEGLAPSFQDHVGRIGALLEPMGARLLPTAMHPWMDPHRELRLWPHEADVIYATFNRIFDCRGHGWANLQSTHVNLPFANDDEFGRLHAAMRLVLPILPALAAASPLADGRWTGTMDTRLDVYRHNADRVPSVAGRVVPEPVFTRADYEAMLAGIYADLAPLDPEGVLAHEWVNSRGCIARFDRMSIEIRLLDAQECAYADVAIASATTETIRALVDERWSSTAAQQSWTVDRLAAILDRVIRDADDAVIEDGDYLAAFGITGRGRMRAGDLWREVLSGGVGNGVPPDVRPALDVITTHGCLARRLRTAVGADAPDRARLRAVYRELADCVATGRSFVSS